MTDPLDAFEWLTTQFDRYTRNELYWGEVRTVLDEAAALTTLFRASAANDGIARFGAALHRVAQANPLTDCTVEYLRRKLLDCTAGGDWVTGAYIAFLLWERED